MDKTKYTDEIAYPNVPMTRVDTCVFDSSSCAIFASPKSATYSQQRAKVKEYKFCSNQQN